MRSCASAQLLLAKEEKSLEDKLENARAPYIQRDKAPDAEQIKTVEAPIRMMNTPSVVDPLELASKIRSLEEEIEDFLSNVDFALSESNAKTEIEIEHSL